jgi:hypothetical protein
MAGAVDLLGHWLKRTRADSFAHYAAQERYSRLNLLIGIPAAILSAVVGTAVFASLESNIDFRAKLIVGVFSIIAAVLTGLQTFLRYSETAETHRKSAVAYSAARREIEELLTFTQRIDAEKIEAVRKRIDAIGETAPNVPRSLFVATRSEISQSFFTPSPEPAVPPVPSIGTVAQDHPGPSYVSQGFPTEGPGDPNPP